MNAENLKKQKQREASARWRANHPDRNRASQKKQDAKPDRKAKQAERARATRVTDRGQAYAKAYRKRPEVIEKSRILGRSDHRRAYMREWRDSDSVRDIKAAYMRNIRKTPNGRINNRMSVAIRRMMNESKANRHWESLVGYSLAELMVHLERQFLKGMSWSNADEWHVDHIIPLSSFVFESYDCAEFKAAWAITNLRPLWAKDNLAKSAKIEGLL
jgi:hypothetical protein